LIERVFNAKVQWAGSSRFGEKLSLFAGISDLRRVLRMALMDKIHRVPMVAQDIPCARQSFLGKIEVSLGSASSVVSRAKGRRP
jgi:hypothetical protein|tara:strand:- start:893 stop:1144 length:252 start_codon:yes stop_codon:yes gene_type:complete